MAQAPEEVKLNLNIVLGILNQFSQSKGGMTIRSIAAGGDDERKLTFHAEALADLGFIDTTVKEYDSSPPTLVILNLWPEGEKLNELLSNTEVLSAVVGSFGLEVEHVRLKEIISFGGKILGDLLKANPERKLARQEKRAARKTIKAEQKEEPKKLKIKDQEPKKVIDQSLLDLAEDLGLSRDDDSDAEEEPKIQLESEEEINKFGNKRDNDWTLGDARSELYERARGRIISYEGNKLELAFSHGGISIFPNGNFNEFLSETSEDEFSELRIDLADEELGLQRVELFEFYSGGKSGKTPLSKLISQVNDERYIEQQWTILKNNIDTALYSEKSHINRLIKRYEQSKEDLQLEGKVARQIPQIEKQKADEVSKIINNPLQLATLNSDSAHKGQDLLGFKQDIEAFASIVSLKDLTPPLAIALFGQWGTGKSFFMQKLSEKVDELAKEQGLLRETEAQETTSTPNSEPFCEGVCQIHFNAWSYMDTNLWASLVTRIFEGLDEYINDNVNEADKEKAEVKSEITSKLDVAKGQLDELESQKKQISNSVETLKTQVNTAQKELKTQVDHIKGANRQVAIDKALKNQAFKAKFEEILQSADMGQSELQEVDPDLILKELKSVHIFAKQLLKFKGTDWIWIVLTLVFFGLAIFAGDWISDQWSTISKAITGGLTLLVGGLSKVRQTINKLSPLVNDVIKVKDEYQQVVRQAVSAHEQSIIGLQIEADQKEIALNELNLQLKAKEGEVKALEFSSEAVLSQKTMYNFITRKAQSSEYSKHLGIISMIRKDFQTLSHLFVESLAELEALRKKVDEGEITEQELEELQKRILSLKKYEDFQKGFNKPLERIVLYIDDLDRCPEERVVEVLEAVNLLMAFPLFVVVVGVDPRWVKNALIKKYYLQFTGHFKGEKDHANDMGVEVINASDYLEKIFQVPFHLMSPSDESIQGMIEHLLKDSIVKEKEEQTPVVEVEASEETEAIVEETAEESGEEEISVRGVDIDDDAVVRNELVDGKNIRSIPGADGLAESTPVIPESVPVTSSKPAPPALKRVTPESLQLHRAELDYMKDFSWLIGNTPRTVKRFVNMYRIIRAHEGLSYNNDEERKDLLVIQFLLAMQIGHYSKYTKQVLDSLFMGRGGPTIGETILIDIAHNDKEIEYHHDSYEEFLNTLRHSNSFEKLKDISCTVAYSYAKFIKRFSFRQILLKEH